MSTNQLMIISFTDPVCTWCWGSEPIFRKLETHFSNQLTFSYVMGGLVENIHQFRDPRNDIGGGGAVEINQQVIKHWLEAAQRHGMPVESKNFSLFSEEYLSTYPQNIAYKAAQRSDPEKADLFLRRIREASAAEALRTTREDVLISLADEVGLTLPLFIQYLRDGSAKQDFLRDLELTHGSNVRGFPTFIVKYKDQEITLRGYTTYETFVSVIEMMTNGDLKPVAPQKTKETLLNLLKTHPKLAAEEIRMAFNFDTINEVDQFIQKLEEEGTLIILPAGQSYFVSLKSNAAIVCDVTRGIC